MKLKPTEHQVQKAIIDYLKLRGILAWRQNSGSVSITDKYGRKRYFRTGIKGLPDIQVLLNGGISLFLEVKAGRNKLSQAQEIFFAKAKKLGFYCEVVRSIEEVEYILKSFNL